MSWLAPVGPVYQAGTLSGNPIAMVAGLALIDELKKPGVYAELERKGMRLSSGLCHAAEAAGVSTYCTRVGSMSCMFFTGERVVDWKTAATSDVAAYARYFRGMLERGVLLAPSQFEAAFVGLAHTDEDIDLALGAAAASLAEL
jgi:glutamate-1-semialdehyde 2,1-aminomutase